MIAVALADADGRSSERVGAVPCRAVRTSFAACTGRGVSTGMTAVRPRAERDIKVLFEHFQRVAEHRDDQHIVERDGQHRLQHLEVLRVQAFAEPLSASEMTDTSDVLFDDRNVLVNERGQRDTKRLRQHDQPLQADEADPERLRAGPCGAHRAMDLGDVGRFADRKRQQAGPERSDNRPPVQGSTCGRL